MKEENGKLRASVQELQRQNQILHEEMEQVGLLLFYDVNVLDIHCSSFALERYFILCGEFYEGYTLKSCMCHVVVQSHGVTAIEVSHLFSHSSSCVLVVQSVSCLVNSSSCVVIVQSVSCLVTLIIICCHCPVSQLFSHTHHHVLSLSSQSAV